MKSFFKKVRYFVSPCLQCLQAFVSYLNISIPSFLYIHLGYKGSFNVYLPNRQKLTLLSWGDSVENSLAWGGWLAHEELERLRWYQLLKLLGSDIAVFDIGANTGTFAFMAKAASPTVKVFAFEPLQRVFHRIKKNSEVSNLKVVAYNVAISNKCGQAKMYDMNTPNVYSASLIHDFLANYETSYFIPTITLNTFCQENNIYPELCKLDVEGAELMALDGAINILSKGTCIFLIELSEASLVNCEHFASILSATKYILLTLDGLKHIAISEAINLIGIKKTINLILCPRSKNTSVKSLSTMTTPKL